MFMNCNKCGTESGESDLFCPFCGNSLKTSGSEKALFNVKSFYSIAQRGFFC